MLLILYLISVIIILLPKFDPKIQNYEYYAVSLIVLGFLFLFYYINERKKIQAFFTKVKTFDEQNFQESDVYLLTIKILSDLKQKAQNKKKLLEELGKKEDKINQTKKEYQKIRKELEDLKKQIWANSLLIENLPTKPNLNTIKYGAFTLAYVKECDVNKVIKDILVEIEKIKKYMEISEKNHLNALSFVIFYDKLKEKLNRNKRIKIEYSNGISGTTKSGSIS